jgi:hypothetical protein
MHVYQAGGTDTFLVYSPAMESSDDNKDGNMRGSFHDFDFMKTAWCEKTGWHQIL